jgi:predicted RNA-binding protein with PUA-like domain
MKKKKKATTVSTSPTPSRVPGQVMYWLLKSEPDVFSWEMQVARGAKGEPWTGVRNYLARNHMRTMQLGDLAFFYHSNIGKEVVGIVRVIALAHPDADDTTGTWECVDVEAVCPLPNPVTLADVKANESLAGMALVTSMRLSVQPVTTAEWAEVCTMAGLDAKAIKALR